MWLQCIPSPHSVGPRVSVGPLAPGLLRVPGLKESPGHGLDRDGIHRSELRDETTKRKAFKKIASFEIRVSINLRLLYSDLKKLFARKMQNWPRGRGRGSFDAIFQAFKTWPHQNISKKMHNIFGDHVISFTHATLRWNAWKMDRLGAKKYHKRSFWIKVSNRLNL